MLCEPQVYATADEYRADTGDDATPAGRVEAMLAQQSAKLRALTGVKAFERLHGDELALARLLVTDACRKALVPPSLGGMGEVVGASQASFSANGFQGSYSLSNPSGTAYFDRSTLSALKRLLGRSQRIGICAPSYGRLS